MTILLAVLAIAAPHHHCLPILKIYRHHHVVLKIYPPRCHRA